MWDDDVHPKKDPGEKGKKSHESLWAVGPKTQPWEAGELLSIKATQRAGHTKIESTSLFLYHSQTLIREGLYRLHCNSFTSGMPCLQYSRVLSPRPCVNRSWIDAERHHQTSHTPHCPQCHKWYCPQSHRLCESQKGSKEERLRVKIVLQMVGLFNVSV